MKPHVWVPPTGKPKEAAAAVARALTKRSDNEGFTYISRGLQAKVLHFEQRGNY